MKLHSVLGADIISQFESYRFGVPLVRHHHERWDGCGYPDGLAGEAIPLGARILAVADTFDVLTSAHPYRSAIPVNRALDILHDGAGSQWDHRVVSELVDLLSTSPTVHSQETHASFSTVQSAAAA